MDPLELIVYLALYLAAGASLKLGDDLLDELELPNLAAGPLGMSGVCFGILMSISEWDFVLLSAIIIGVLASGKVNRYQYAVGFVTIAVMLLLLGIPMVSDLYGSSALLVMLLLAAILDEHGNDWTDRNSASRTNIFFKYRLTLKVSVLLLSLLWPSFLFSAIGLWFFDGGYELVGWLVRKHQSQSSDMQDYNTHL